VIAVDAREGADGVPDGFVQVSRLVYADDPLWTPEEAADVARAFSPANPWFSGEGRAARVFVVPGRARAAAFDDPGAPIPGPRAVFFGYWESVGDVEAERALLDAIRRWARERGAGRLLGPVQFSTARSYRLRVAMEPGGVPIVGEPHNPARYPEDLEAHGFSVVRRYETKLLDRAAIEAAEAGAGPFLDRVLAEGYRFEPLHPETWVAHLREVHALVEAAFSASFGYAPMRFEEFSAVAGESLARKLDPERSALLFDPSGAVAGLVHVLPHWGPLTVQRAGAGRVRAADLDWREHARRLAALGPVDWVMKTIAVAPNAERRGLGHAIIARCARQALQAGARVYGALAREDAGSRRLVPGETASRWFALYESQ
jgi:hypothetical protein